MNDIPVSLTRLNARKLKKGLPFQLRGGQIGSGDHFLSVHPALHTKLQKHAGKKGMRIKLSPEEVSASMTKMGGRIRFTSLRKGSDGSIPRTTDLPNPTVEAGRGIHTPQQPALVARGETRGTGKKRPKVRKILTDVVRGISKVALPALAGSAAQMLGVPAPVGAVAGKLGSDVVNEYADDAINWIGDKTGGFGVGYKLRTGTISNSHSNFLHTTHPSMRPGDTRFHQGEGLYAPGYKGGMGLYP